LEREEKEKPRNARERKDPKATSKLPDVFCFILDR